MGRGISKNLEEWQAGGSRERGEGEDTFHKKKLTNEKEKGKLHLDSRNIHKLGKT